VSKEKKPQPEVLLKAENLEKSYKTSRDKLHVLRGINLEIYPGEMNWIVGRSGSGKSTLMHLLGALDRPDQGEIYFESHAYSKLSERRIDKIRGGKIGFVFQAFHLLPELTLFENVYLPLLISGPKDKNWVTDILKRVGLYERRHHFPSELSGGEQQRVAIARAFVARPRVILCDEPTGNLDPETAEIIVKLMHELNREGQAFVTVTHDESLARAGGKLYRLEGGRLNLVA